MCCAVLCCCFRTFWLLFTCTDNFPLEPICSATGRAAHMGSPLNLMTSRPSCSQQCLPDVLCCAVLCCPFRTFWLYFTCTDNFPLEPICSATGRAAHMG